MQGLGDLIAWATRKIGIKPCPACKDRQEFLNDLVPFGTRRVHSDGTIKYIRRGKVPEIPPGYERHPHDPYTLIPMWVPCEHRAETVAVFPCCGPKQVTVCTRYKRSTDRLNCANCHHHGGNVTDLSS